MSNKIAVLSLFRSRQRLADWTQDELAEFYRVESALLQAGLFVTTDRGSSDEGDPWFVFCRQDNDEIIAHFARIDSNYIAVSSAFSGVARGQDFGLLVRDLLGTHAVALSCRPGQRQNVFLHPTAMLIALISTSYLMSSDAELHQKASPLADQDESAFVLRRDFAILSAVAVVTTWLEHQVVSGITLKHDAVLSGEAVPGESTVATFSSRDYEDARSDSLLASFSVNARAPHWMAGDLSTHFSSLDLLGEESRADQPGLTGTAVRLVGVQVSPMPAFDKFVDNVANASVDGNAASNLKGTPNIGDSDVLNFAGQSLTPANVPDALTANLTRHEPNAQVSASSSGSIVRTDAYSTVSSDLNGNLNQPIVISTDKQPLINAIEQVLTNVGYSTHTSDAAGSNLVSSANMAAANMAATETPSFSMPSAANPTAASVLTAASSPAAMLPPAFDNQADQIMKTFLQNTHIEIALSGHNVIIVDTDVSHATNPDFGIQTWELTDGSTISIVGIIPHPSAHVA